MAPSFEGRAVGHRAALSVDDAGLQVTLSIDWAGLDNVKRLGPNIILKMGDLDIWIEMADVEPAYDAVIALAPERALRPVEREASAPPPKKRRRFFNG